MTQDDLLYLIAFTQIKGINDTQRKILLATYGSAATIYKNRSVASEAFPGLNTFIKQLLCAEWPLKEAAKEIDFMVKHKITACSIQDPTYPDRLIHCEDAPTLLYVKGAITFNKKQVISIVGTRQHTQQAQKIISELVEGLKHLNISIISGMALGIDGLVHQAALDNDIPTWGVLAHGLDQIYPTQHRRLAIRMLEQGGLITENKMGTTPLPFLFPKRNRIVAGMSDVTIIIETDIKGGSMITAKLASGYQRDVFAVPGKLSDPKTKGCLHLIKTNMAQLYYDPTDLLENLSWDLPTHSPLKKTVIQSSLPLDPLSISILKVIELLGPVDATIIATKVNIHFNELNTLLLQLEMQELIYKQAGNLYNLL